MSISKLQQARNPNKIWHFMPNRSKINETPIIAPISIEIQPTSACNLRCKWCSYWDRNGFGKTRPQSLSLSVIENIADFASQNGTKSIYIAGGGEPCAYQNIREMVEILSNKGLSLAMITNGTLFAKKLSNQADKFSYLQVSLISSDKENYNDSTRSSVGYEEMKLLPSVIKDQHGNNSPTIGGMYVITKWNYTNALKAIDFCTENLFDYCSFRAAIDFEDRGVALNNEIINELKANLKPHHKKFSNLEKVLANALNNQYATSNCLNIHYGLYCIIDPHGGVFLCIPDVGNKRFCIGNLYEQSFQEIWQGKEHKKIVQNLENRYKCNGCHYACRAHAYNAVYQQSKPIVLPELHKNFL